MRARRMALYLVISLVAILAIGAVFVLSTDLGRFKGQAESFLSEALGRVFAVDGELHVTVGRHIELSATNVRLASTEWSADRNLVEVDRFSATIRTLSLFSGPVRIEELVVAGVRASLEQDESGNDNWTLSSVEDEEPVVAERPSLPAIVTNARIRDVLVSYSSPERTQPLQFSARSIDVASVDPDRLELTIDGAMNDRPVELRLTAGTVAGLVDYRNVDFTLSGHLGEIQIEGEMMLADLIDPERPTAALSIQGPNAEYLTEMLRLDPVTTGPMNLSASVAPLGDKMLLTIAGQFGEFSIDASGHADNLRSLQHFDIHVAASGPNAGTVGRLLGNDTVPEDPFNIVADINRAGSVLAINEITIAVGETRFKLGGQVDGFPASIGARLTVRINGPDFGRFNKLLGLPGRLGGPFSLDVDLEPLSETKTSVSLAAMATDVQATVEGTFVGTPGFVGTQLQARIQGPNLRTLTRAANLEQAPEEPVDLTIAIERVDNGIRIDSGRLAIGPGVAEFSGLIGNEPLEKDTDIRLQLSGPNLAKTLVAFGIDADELPYAPYKLVGRVERADDGFLLHNIKAEIGTGGDYDVAADGMVTLEPDFVGSRLDVNVRGTSLGAITDAAGITGIPDVPFNGSATISRTSNGFSVQNGKARLGDDSATIDGFVGEQPLARDTDIRFSATAPDLKATLAAFGMELDSVPTGGFSSSGRIRSRGDQVLLSDISTTFAGAKMILGGKLGGMPSMNGTDLDVQISGDDLSRLLPAGDSFESLIKSFALDTKIRIEKNVVNLSKLEFRLDASRVNADIEFGMSPRFGHGQFTINAASPDVQILVPELSEVSTKATVPLDLRTSGSWADDLWRLDSLYMQLGQATMRAQGSIDRPPNFDNTDLTFDLDVPSVANFSTLAGRQLPDHPVRVTFRLSGTPDVLTMDNFEATVGDSDLTGTLTVRSDDVPNVDVTLRSSRLNIAPYLPPLEDKKTTEVVEAAEKPSRLIPDTEIPLDLLHKFRSSVDVSIGELVLRQRTMKDIELIASAGDGALLVPRFNVENSVDGSLSGGFALKSVDDAADLLLDIQGSSLNLGLPADTPEELAALPRFDVDTVLAGQGKTLSELAGSLGGYVKIAGGEGQVKSSAMQYFAGDFLLQVLNAVNPFAESDPYTHLTCTAVLALVNDGVVSGKPILMGQTDKIRYSSTASVDLKTEKIAAHIRTTPMKGLGLSFSDLVNPFIKLGGTLARPTLALDPEGALLEGGAAVATAGISFLAKRFNERFLKAKDQCAKAIEDSNADFLAQREKYRPGTSEPQQ